MKSDVIPFNFDDFKRVAKRHKKMWVETSDRGDVPPTVFVEKDGQVVATIVAPQVDKHAGLHAAALARMGFDADALSIIMDAHTASVKAKEGATMEEAEAEFRKQYPPGSMQKMCDEEGACERGDIVDVLLCQRIDRDGNFKMFLLPYSYHGKGGPEFKWLDKHPAVEGFDPDAIDNTKCKGFIPEALREIIAQKQFLDQEKIGELLKELGDGMDVPRNAASTTSAGPSFVF
jgi:arginine repressor